MSGHTPGQWASIIRHDVRIVRSCDEGVSIAEVFNNGSTDEAIANARLIAAAPDLLAACEKAADDCEECDTDSMQYDTGEPCVYCAHLRAAVAKATP